jgi:hypothetical protein
MTWRDYVCDMWVRYVKSFVDPPDLSLWKEDKWHNDLESCLVWICCDSELPVHKNKPWEPLQFHVLMVGSHELTF